MGLRSGRGGSQAGEVDGGKCRDKRVLVRRNILEQPEGKELRRGSGGRTELGCEGVVKAEGKISTATLAGGF